jgi:hypothetical protein
MELYPKSSVGFQEEEPKMALPDPPMPTRRRQILDDQTEATRHFNARAYQDTRADGDSLASGDPWVKNFVDRLAALVDAIGGKN